MYDGKQGIVKGFELQVSNVQLRTNALHAHFQGHGYSLVVRGVWTTSSAHNLGDGSVSLEVCGLGTAQELDM
jgi:hypothetical protein